LRLWSIHPKYLDASGLVALWREALLAQEVLKEKTKGYKNHPQLTRFRAQSKPEQAIAFYLNEIWKEADGRGYNFDQYKIGKVKKTNKIPITNGQLVYEIKWLCSKLKNRSPKACLTLQSTRRIETHPIFKVVKGDIANWEKVKKC
jgi:hypothetical protein